MRKYPPVNFKLIERCIKSIKTLDFDTYDFIDILKIKDRAFYNIVSGIGNGWKSVIGKNLSKYASNTQKIKKGKRKGNAQPWIKR
jgi:hypothetical protein